MGQVLSIAQEADLCMFIKELTESDLVQDL